MITFKSAKKKIELTFEDEEQLQLCPKCGTPNKLGEAFCADCFAQLQRPLDEKYPRASEIVTCPSCGRYNVAGDQVCANGKCRASLEKETDEVNEEQKGKSVPVYVKVCPSCGHENPPVDVCENCGRDISLELETERSRGCSIVDMWSGERLDLPMENKTIGRENFLSEKLRERTYVGRSHADLIWREGRLYIRDHSTNGTYLNGVRIERDREVPVEPGTVIGLGDPSPAQPLSAHFRFEENAY